MILTDKELVARSKVCLPLDNLETMQDLAARVENLSPVVGLFKVGMETYTRFGPRAIELVKKNGSDVFLDLKYHDIPNTVKGAADAATQLGVEMFTVHTSGGLPMLQAAVEGVNEGAIKYGHSKPKVIGVTVLTSHDEATYLQAFKYVNPTLKNIDFNKYTTISGSDEFLQEQFRKLLDDYDLTEVISNQVIHLSHLANIANLDGIVCAAADLGSITGYIPKRLMKVTPGIKRPGTEGAGADQRRVYTPGLAVQDGSSILVIGRAITGQKTPEERLQAGYEVLRDMVQYL